jgi:ABC-type nitrate/sulfonate/bicarbonate transport system substrate-binding protein
MKNQMLIEKLLRFLPCVVITYLLMCGFSAYAAAPIRTNFATSITSESMAVVWVAKERGLFQKYGLEVQAIQMPRSALTVTALIAGEIDAAIIGPGHLLNAAIANFVQKLDYRFIGRPEIKRAEDLRGKRVAISGPGAVSHVVALLAVQNLGLDPNRDKITFLSIPGTEMNRRIALESVSVDASALNGAIGDLYASRGYTLLFNFKGSGISLAQTALATSRRIIAAKPQVIDGYLKAFIEALNYILEPANKAPLMRVIAANLRLESAAAEDAYQAVVNSYDRIPYPNVDGIKRLQSVMVQLNPKLANVKAESVVDSSVISRIEAAGFSKSLSKTP